MIPFKRRLLTLGLVLLSLTALLGYTRLVQVSQGGTGASTAAAARVSLGVPRITASTSAPTVNDDTDQGYKAGDLWVDTDSDATYQADSVADGAADWRALLSSGTDRSILITTSGGALVATERLGSIADDTWTTVGTLTVTEETTTCDLVLAGSTATLPSGTTTTSAAQSHCYEAYVLLSDASGDFDTALAAAFAPTTASYTTVAGFAMDFDTIEAVSNARLGCALARTTGTAFDTAGEGISTIRVGWNGSANAWGHAAAGASITTLVTDDGTGLAMQSGVGGVTSSMLRVDLGGGSYDASTPSWSASAPDRLYLIGGATSSSTASDADFGFAAGKGCVLYLRRGVP